MSVTALSHGSTETLAARELSSNVVHIRHSPDVCICLPSCSFELFQGSEAPRQSRNASVGT